MFNTTPKVLIVDDDNEVLQSIARTVTAAGYRVATFTTARDFLSSSDLHPPCCAVLDIKFDGTNGIQMQKSLATQYPLIPVIFVTASASIQACVAALKAGAIDYLVKPIENSKFLESVEQALSKQLTKCTRILEVSAYRERLLHLTSRERQVLDLVITGHLNKQIAAILGTSEKTIKVHRGRVMKKMKAHSLAELVRIAERAADQTDDHELSSRATPV